MGHALELIAPISGGAAGVERFLQVLPALFTGNPLLIAAATYSAYAPLFAPRVPGPEIQLPQKSAYPPRRSAYGTVRMSGYYLLFAAKDGKSWDVLAVHDGQINAVVGYYLNDNLVTLDGSNWANSPDGQKYADQHVKFLTTLGADPSTAFSEIASDLSGDDVWTTNHRGDGVALIGLICIQASDKKQTARFPDGLPLPSIVVQALSTLDVRDDVTRWSENGPLALADYLTSTEHGMGMSFARRITPAIDYWKAAAADCDRTVALAAGGTELRYRTCGAFDHTTDPSEVIGAMLASFDGWLAPRGDGALIIRSGLYEAPTVTFFDDHVIGYTLQHYTRDESAVNEMTISFTDPNAQFNQGDAGVWRDVSDIEARGLVRSQPLALAWVPSPSQARRLAKRQMARIGAPLRGTLKTNLYGLKALGERYIALDITDNAALHGVVVEVQRVDIDISTLSVTFQWVLANSNIDAWDPDTEEDPLSEGGTISESDFSDAVIDSLTAFFESNGPGSVGVRLHVDAHGPSRPDLTWQVRWRVSGAAVWTGPFGLDVPGDTGFVTSDATIEVQVAYTTGDGFQSDWAPSTPATVSTTSAGVAPTSPSLLAATGHTGNADLHCRNSSSTNFNSTRFYVGTTTFGAATAVGSDIIGTPGGDSDYNATLAAGSWKVWAVCKNASGAASAPTGPVSFTVT